MNPSIDSGSLKDHKGKEKKKRKKKRKKKGFGIRIHGSNRDLEV